MVRNVAQNVVKIVKIWHNMKVNYQNIKQNYYENDTIGLKLQHKMSKNDINRLQKQPECLSWCHNW